MDTNAKPVTATRKPWPDYRTLWRWHFYAGLICIPFVMWLSITGTIYLLRPQIEAALDKPYDALTLSGPPAPVSDQVIAALTAVPGGVLQAYQVPATPSAAARVLVVHGEQATRVYLNPQTLEILHIVDEDKRLMPMISRLHGELLIGDRGSMIVEIAACWAIVMIITGLALWWPRGAGGLGGILYPRIGTKWFLRDLHGVTGMWVSALALFLIVTGLPWAKNWGAYFKEVRTITGQIDGPQDWSSGRSAELAQRVDATHAEHMGMDMAAMAPHAPSAEPDFTALDRMAPAVNALKLAPPVLLAPPKEAGGLWIARSDAADRPLRATLQVDGETGAVVARTNFNQRHPIDQAVGVGVAAHEGQLFGWPNQMLSLLTTLGLMTLTISAVALWLKRRPSGVLGAPQEQLPARLTLPLALATIALALAMPLWGASLGLVLLLEFSVLRRARPVRDWLGLRPLASR